MPKVIIIIPTFNQADWLGACLRSVFDQTFQDFKIIVVNNFSTDHTKEVIEEFEDERLTHIEFFNEGVIGAARNRGAKAAKGEWLAFLDSDDLWVPTKLEECLKDVEDENLITHMAERFDGQYTRGFTKQINNDKLQYKNMLFEGNPLITSTTMVKADFFNKAGGFPINKEFITVEDYALWLNLAKIGIQAKIINIPLARYRLHSDQNSAKPLFHYEASKALVEHHYYTLNESKVGIYEAVRFLRLKSILLYGAGRKYQSARETLKALKFFFKSLKTYPFFPKTYVATFLTLLRIR